MEAGLRAVAFEGFSFCMVSGWTGPAGARMLPLPASSCLRIFSHRLAGQDLGRFNANVCNPQQLALSA